MGLFRPSASKVAAEVDKTAARMTGAFVASMSRNYPELASGLQKTAVASILIDVAADILLRGIALTRGPVFAQKASFEFARREGTRFEELVELCLEATRSGRTQESAVARLVSYEAGTGNPSDWEKFVTEFKQNMTQAVFRASQAS